MATELELVAKVAALETKVAALEHTLSSMDGKLDSILHLRSAGQGAFWLASALVGTGIIGTFVAFINFLGNVRITA